MDSLLAVRGLRVLYHNKTVLEIPSLEIHSGEVLAILGPNGAGKSTLLRILAFLEDPREGEILFAGEKISPSSDRLALRRKITLVFPDPLLYSTTVRKNIASGLLFRGLSSSDIAERVKSWLKRLSITHLSERPAHRLSRGEAQRVSLARALATRPELLLMDEPFANLDHPTKEALIPELRSLFHEEKTTVVFVTQDRDEALILADRIAVMDTGKIVQIGSPEEAFNRPLTDTVARFVGVDLLLSGVVISRKEGLLSIKTKGHTIDAVGNVEVGTEVYLSLRSEDVMVSVTREGVSLSSARNRFRGRITQMIPVGFHYKVTIDCGFPLVSFVTHQSAEDLSLFVGREVIASFKAASVHVIKKTAHDTTQSAGQRENP